MSLKTSPLRAYIRRAALPLFALPFTSLFSASIAVERHAPDNIFNVKDPVSFNIKLKDAPGKADVQAVVKNFAGQEVWNKTVSADAKPTALDIGKLPYGYYELELTSGEMKGKATFGVIEFVKRTAEEVRKGNYVFGLKWWGGVTKKDENLAAMQTSGFQWTRLMMKGEKDVDAAKMVDTYQINVVSKIERFPQELYDVERYGPLDEWEKKYGKGAWTLKTLPKMEPYKKLVAEELSKIPASQKVFEIWNEPWDKMSPEDFAQLSQWIAEVVLKERPDAILGPNLAGNTSEFEYDARVIKAGGLKGMKMVALHPYAGSEDREWLQNYEKWLKEQTGTDMQIYVTECGSHSTPEGPSMRSEAEQARRTVRQALSLYAGDVKAIMPHWLGQAEANKTYIEDWFGFVRKNEEVKPVWVAYANAARLVDGTKYLGDLWYGPRVAAMLFADKKGVNTLALWTLREPGKKETEMAQKTVEIDTGVPSLTQIEMIGTEQKVKTNGGKLSVNVTEAPVYLVGVNPDLAKQASMELRPDRFPKPEKPPRAERNAPMAKTPPSFDGKFDTWQNGFQLAMVNPKVAGMDCSGTGYITWDDQFLYVAVDMRDNEMLNVQPRAKLYRQDSMELWVGTVPRDSGSGYADTDHQFFVTPASGEGGPIFGEVKDAEAGVIEDVKGGKFWAGKTGLGWGLQVAIPWSDLGGFKPTPGAKIVLNARVNDADSSHERFKIDPQDGSAELGFVTTDPTTWPYVILQP